MKYLVVDYGTKRIGIAVSDDTAALAFPLTTIAAGPQAAQALAEIARREGAAEVVLGESRNFKGEANAVMEDIAKFKVSLEAAGLVVVYEPEFMTSALAVREGETKDIDASAAAIILQSHQDRMKWRTDVE